MTVYSTRRSRWGSGPSSGNFSTLVCDAQDCHTTPRRGDSAALLRKVARELGWVRVEGKDYCPEHSCPHGYVPGDHHYEGGCRRTA